MRDDRQDHCHDDYCLDINCNFIHHDCHNIPVYLGLFNVFAGSICQSISPNTIYKYLEKSYVLRVSVFPFKVYPTELEPLVCANDEDHDDDSADKLV